MVQAPKGLPAPGVQRLRALIPEVLVNPDVASRLEEPQTLPRRNAVIGHAFVQPIHSQTERWRSVAKPANGEVIT